MKLQVNGRIRKKKSKKRPARVENLSRLVDMLQEMGAATFYAHASGRGDEGVVESPDIKAADGTDISCDFDLEDLVNTVMDEHGFNYVDGDGGSLTLRIDVATRTCSWSATVVQPVAVDLENPAESV